MELIQTMSISHGYFLNKVFFFITDTGARKSLARPNFPKIVFGRYVYCSLLKYEVVNFFHIPNGL